MSKLDLLTIAIVLVCVGALGYLVYKIVNLMNPPEEPTTSIQDSYDANATDDATYTDWDDEVDTAGDDVDLDDDDAGSQIADDADNSNTEAGSTSTGSTYDEDELDEGSTEVAETERIRPAANAPSSSAGSGTTTAYDSSGGKYMVVAGAFRQRSNADDHAARIRKLGYESTQVKIFDRGSYAVVLVDRFASLSKAKSLVSDLAGDGIEAIVDAKN